MKRLFDVIFSFLGLILLAPLFVIVAVLIKLESRGTVFFVQERIGKDFKPFSIYKFRSMINDAFEKGPPVTIGNDERITRIGKLLRRTKIDELPQLINILCGDMSFVGPRPELKKYVEMFRSDYEKLLEVRPGITDPASIKFSDEASMLSSSEDWEKKYVSIILPEKIKLALEYVENHNIFLDLRLIFRTVLRV
jgi:lipopolysaccharide/colanic/teichoic acid biosynthesis glycosyltransferase